MSKISEQKALEAYPEVKYKTLGMLEGGGLIEVDLNIQKRNGYIKGYDQAMQDFMEKAITYLTPITYTHPHLIDLDGFKQTIETSINTEEVKSDIDFGYYWGMYVEEGGNINNYEVAKYFFELGNKLKEEQNEV